MSLLLLPLQHVVADADAVVVVVGKTLQGAHLAQGPSAGRQEVLRTESVRQRGPPSSLSMTRVCRMVHRKGLQRASAAIRTSMQTELTRRYQLVRTSLGHLLTYP